MTCGIENLFKKLGGNSSIMQFKSLRDPTRKINLVREQRILADPDGSHPQENYEWKIGLHITNPKVDIKLLPPTTRRTTHTVLGPDGFAAGKNRRYKKEPKTDVKRKRRKFVAFLQALFCSLTLEELIKKSFQQL